MKAHTLAKILMNFPDIQVDVEIEKDVFQSIDYVAHEFVQYDTRDKIELEHIILRCSE